MRAIIFICLLVFSTVGFGTYTAFPSVWKLIVDQGGILTSDGTTSGVLQVGTDGQVLKADSGSGDGSGLVWDAPPYLGVLGKGSILTSDGTTNGEFTACGDDEILVWDSTVTGDPAGVKCEAKPSSGSVNYQKSSSCGTFSTTSTSFVDVTNLSATITTTGNPVFVAMIPDETTSQKAFSNSGSFVSQVRIVRDATQVSYTQYIDLTYTDLKTLDPISAGTYTYKVQAKSASAGTTNVYNFKLVAWEIK